MRGPFCRVTRNSAQSISAGATSKIAFNTVTVDTHGDTSGSGTTFTPEVPGVYHVSAGVGLPIASGKTMSVAIYKSGTPVSQLLLSAGATGTHVAQASVDIEMNGSTDTLEAYVFNGDTGAQNTDANAYNTFMTVERVR